MISDEDREAIKRNSDELGRLINQAENENKLRQLERNIQAHSHQKALRDAHIALDRGHPANLADEYSHLFPPHDPLGPPEDDEEMSHDHNFAPKRKPKVSDQEKRRASASAPYSDREIFESLYPPGTRFDPDED